MVARTLTLLPSASRTATGQSAGQDVAEGTAAFYLDCTAASGTSPTLDVTIQAKDPIAAVWHDVATFTQLTTTGTERVAVNVLPDDTLRVNFTIGGTTPDFTFSVTASLKD